MDTVVPAAASSPDDEPIAIARTSQKATRGNGFTGVEDVLNCKAYFSTSEDRIKGAKQSGSVFANEHYRRFVLFLGEQEEADRLSFQRLSRTLGHGNVGAPPEVYSRRSAQSITNRFRMLSTRAMTMIAIEKSLQRASGANDEEHFKACVMEYENRYQSTLGKFDIIRACYPVMKDSSKYLPLKEVDDKADGGAGSLALTPPNGTKAARKSELKMRLKDSAAEVMPGFKVNATTQLPIGLNTVMKQGSAIMMSAMQQQHHHLQSRYKADLEIANAMDTSLRKVLQKRIADDFLESMEEQRHHSKKRSLEDLMSVAYSTIKPVILEERAKKIEDLKERQTLCLNSAKGLTEAIEMADDPELEKELKEQKTEYLKSYKEVGAELFKLQKESD
jgi:hypothetical protein